MDTNNSIHIFSSFLVMVHGLKLYGQCYILNKDVNAFAVD